MNTATGTNVHTCGDRGKAVCDCSWRMAELIARGDFRHLSHALTPLAWHYGFSDRGVNSQPINAPELTEF
jgi:hypothetical protein